MGNKLFGVNISGIIKKEIGPGVLPLILHVVTPGTRTSSALTGGTNPTEKSSSARGFIDEYDDAQQPATLQQKSTRTIVIIGDTIAPAAVPKPSDKVTIEGTTYTIVKVTRDPAAATYTCTAKSS